MDFQILFAVVAWHIECNKDHGFGVCSLSVLWWDSLSKWNVISDGGWGVACFSGRVLVVSRGRDVVAFLFSSLCSVSFLNSVLRLNVVVVRCIAVQRVTCCCGFVLSVEIL